MPTNRIVKAAGFTFIVFSILFIVFVSLEAFLFCGDNGKCFVGTGILKGQDWNWNGNSSKWEQLTLKHYYHPNVGAPTAQ
jgi:hypothetical protein